MEEPPSTSGTGLGMQHGPYRTGQGRRERHSPAALGKRPSRQESVSRSMSRTELRHKAGPRQLFRLEARWLPESSTPWS